MNELPLLSDIDNVLASADAVMGGSEAHGALCGMLCARGLCDFSAWTAHVLADDQSATQLQDVVQQLSLVHRITTEQINDALAEFHLLLPDDDSPLAARAGALGEWCQGFLFGLAAGGLKQESQLPENSEEILRDMLEISRAGVDEDEALGEADEVALMELVEYVRTGVLLINEELQPLQGTNTLQ